MVQIIGVFIVIMLEVNVVKVCFTICSTWQIPFFGPPWRLKPEPHGPWAWCWMVAAGCMRIPCACGAFPRCLGLVATLLKKDAARKLECFVQILVFVFVDHSVFCLLSLEMDWFFVCVCGLPRISFSDFWTIQTSTRMPASWQCCVTQSGNRSLSQDHWRRWLFRVFTSQAEDVPFRWGWELVHWEHATDLCH